MEPQIGDREVVAGAEPPTVVATDDVRARVRGLGGILFVWMTVHGCCSGRVRLLEASTARPDERGVRFEPIDADGFTVQLDSRALRSLHTLVLETGRRGAINAYWNDQAWVG